MTVTVTNAGEARTGNGIKYSTALFAVDQQGAGPKPKLQLFETKRFQKPTCLGVADCKGFGMCFQSAPSSRKTQSVLVSTPFANLGFVGEVQVLRALDC